MDEAVSGEPSVVLDESIVVALLMSEMLREIEGAGAGDVCSKGELTALARAAERAFCSAVIPRGLRGTACTIGGNADFEGGIGGSEDCIVVVAVADERAGDVTVETGLREEAEGGGGGRGRTLENLERPRPGVSGIDAMTMSR